MISKRIDRKKGQPSSYSKLIDYLLSDKGLDPGERVVHVWTRNCITDDIDLCKREVEATQAMNQRVQSDKIYHLVLSFREADELTESQLMEIEQYFCDSLGFGEHQRISVVHGDTANQHIHIAINKIHPQKLTIHNPFLDMKRRQEMCRAMEIKYGLEKEPNRPEKSHIMKSQGLQSFEDWIKENAKDALLKALDQAQSWEDIQKAAGKFDIEFRKSGAGLAISHKSQKLFVKASSIDRKFSYKNLVQRFGEFDESSRNQGMKPSISYFKSPKARDSQHLWSEYLSYKTDAKARREEELRALTAAKISDMRVLRDKIRDKKIALKVSQGLSWVEKKSQRSVIAAEHVYLKSEINKSYADKRRQISDNNNILGWQEWLLERSGQGDLEAIKALQKIKKPPAPKRDQALIKGATFKDYLASVRFDVKRNGEVHYHVGNSVVVDQGNGVRIMQGASKEAIDFAVELSKSRFGQQLKVEGDAGLCQQVKRRIQGRGVQI